MNKKQIVNGLTRDDIVLLYRYLEFYEKKQIKTFTTDKQLKALLFGNVSQVWLLVRGCNLKSTKKGNIPTDLPPKNTIYFVKHYTIMLSLLYHLRNSIAHALMYKVGKEYHVCDIESNKNKRLTMIGNIDVTIVKSLIKIMV